ncbi:MAG: hypothetical protein Q9191_006287, partial [Dirinaria sp. TL-2023a]
MYAPMSPIGIRPIVKVDVNNHIRHEIEYYAGKADTSGYAMAIFPTAQSAQEALPRLRKRNIFDMKTSIDLAEEGYDPQNEGTIISITEKSLPAHLIFPSYYDPSAGNFPDLEAAIEEGREAALKSVAEKRRLYITHLPFGTDENVVQELLKDYST